MKTESKIKDIVSLQERIEKLEFILEASEEIDTKLSDRVSKLEVMLNEQTQPKSILEENKINGMEEKLSELGQNFYILMNSVDDLERTSKLLSCQYESFCKQNQNMKCGICGQIFPSEQALSDHFRRYHKTFKT